MKLLYDGKIIGTITTNHSMSIEDCIKSLGIDIDKYEDYELFTMDWGSSQTQANKNWQEKNREKARYLRNRSATRNFLKNEATSEDIREMEEIIENRKKDLESDKNKYESQ